MQSPKLGWLWIILYAQWSTPPIVIGEPRSFIKSLQWGYVIPANFESKSSCILSCSIPTSMILFKKWGFLMTLSILYFIQIALFIFLTFPSSGYSNKIKTVKVTQVFLGLAPKGVLHDKSPSQMHASFICFS